MSMMSTALRCCSVSIALASVPATAAPNVFWTFGFEQRYSHGTGGRAELPVETMFAARVPADSKVASAFCVAPAIIPVLIDVTLASHPAVTGRQVLEDSSISFPG